MTNLREFYKNETDIIVSKAFAYDLLFTFPLQYQFIKNKVNNTSITNVMEIGFCGGHSAELLLSSNKNINLVSFDIGEHACFRLGKQFIDRTYPGRHELIIGNSLTTVPEYIRKNSRKFDLIFIDGGHKYNIAKGDLINCKHLSHEKTIVIMDDTVNKEEWVANWNLGPNRAWKEAKESSIIKEFGSEDYSRGRGFSWGYYKF